MKRVIILLAIILLGMLGIALICTVVDGVIQYRKMQSAPVIVEAIYEYKQVNHEFPERLDDLVPIYLDRVPDGFFYATNPLDGFVLSYRLRPNYGCGFADRSTKWECRYRVE